VIDLHKLPTRNQGGAVHVVVESPRGSEVKLKYDPDVGVFTVSRPLVLGVPYPFDWGFIPSTEAEDGDPLDAMILWDVPTFPGVVVPCRPLAILELEENASGKKGKRERNDRVLAVPLASARGEELRSPDDLPARVRKELERFFVVVTGFARKDVAILGWKGHEAAERLVDKSRTRHR
jgi:inorganic pyrophosphatase